MGQFVEDFYTLVVWSLLVCCWVVDGFCNCSLFLN